MNKYTSDGRKVLVVGKLNATEHIVQEIFVAANGQEIASGENFVVKSLHDAPVESWKAKNLRETEAKYEKEMAALKRATEEAEGKAREAQEKAKFRAATLFAFAKNADDVQLQRLRALLAGEITHFFLNRYRPQIVTWDDEIVYQTDRNWGRLKVEGIKLLSLFGRSDGRLDFKLHDYSDGSGSSLTIIPCRSYEEALAEAQKQLDAEAALYMSGTRGCVSFDEWRHIKGIELPTEAYAKHVENQRKNNAERIAKLRAEISAIEAKAI
jgi:hypothetical protein